MGIYGYIWEFPMTIAAEKGKEKSMAVYRSW